MLRRHRIREVGQAKMGMGQEGRETSPGAPKQNEAGLEEGSCCPEEKQAKPVETRARQDGPRSIPTKPSMIRKEISSSQEAGLVHKDESENSPRTNKSVPKGRAKYENFITQESETSCEENNVKQKGKSPTQEDGFAEKAEETGGPPKSFTQQLPEELGGRKVSEKRIVKGKVIGKNNSNSDGNVAKFLAHRLRQQHHRSHSAGKDYIQEKSCIEKRGAKKDFDGKILTKGKLDAEKIRAKK